VRTDAREMISRIHVAKAVRVAPREGTRHFSGPSRHLGLDAIDVDGINSVIHRWVDTIFVYNPQLVLWRLGNYGGVAELVAEQLTTEHHTTGVRVEQPHLGEVAVRLRLAKHAGLSPPPVFQQVAATNGAALVAETAVAVCPADLTDQRGIFDRRGRRPRTNGDVGCEIAEPPIRATPVRRQRTKPRVRDEVAELQTALDKT